MCKLAKRNVAGGLIPCTTLRKSVLRDHENGYVHQAIINPPKETITAALTEANSQEQIAMMQCFRMVYTLAKNDISLANYSALRSLATVQSVPTAGIVDGRYMRYNCTL